MTLKQIMQSSTPEKCLSRLLFHNKRPSNREPFCRGGASRDGQYNDACINYKVRLFSINYFVFSTLSKDRYFETQNLRISEAKLILLILGTESGIEKEL